MRSPSGYGRCGRTAGGLWSAGYEGRDIDSFLASLVGSHISAVADVRLTPISRKKGFSKTRLGEALAEAGIEYMHLRGLGNPKDNREPFWDGRVEVERARFRGLLRSDEAQAHLDRLAEHARASRRGAVLREGREPLSPAGRPGDGPQPGLSAGESLGLTSSPAFARDLASGACLSSSQVGEIDGWGTRFRLEPAEPRSVSKAALADQLDLLEQELNPLEWVPLDFRYGFRCADDDCPTHDMGLKDWEAGQSYRKFLREYGERGVREALRETWCDRMFMIHRTALGSASLRLLQHMCLALDGRPEGLQGCHVPGDVVPEGQAAQQLPDLLTRLGLQEEGPHPLSREDAAGLGGRGRVGP